MSCLVCEDRSSVFLVGLLVQLVILGSTFAETAKLFLVLLL